MASLTIRDCTRGGCYGERKSRLSTSWTRIHARKSTYIIRKFIIFEPLVLDVDPQTFKLNPNSSRYFSITSTAFLLISFLRLAAVCSHSPMQPLTKTFTLFSHTSRTSWSPRRLLSRLTCPISREPVVKAKDQRDSRFFRIFALCSQWARIADRMLKIDL